MPVLSELTPYLLTLGVLIALSAFFSGTEVALFSLRRVDRKQMEGSKRRSDSLLMRMLDRPRRLIATLLIGNEFVNVSVSAVVAGMVSVLFADDNELQQGALATGIALPLLLFFGEITPKTVAIKTAVAWARAVARPLYVFDLIVTPIRFVVRLLAGLVLRPFGDGKRSEPKDLSEDEYKALVDAGSVEGMVDARERRLIHRVFEFGEKTVAQVMTPRKKIFALSYELSLSRLTAEVAKRGYSRVPIYHKSHDRIRGILYAKDLVVSGTGLSAPRRLEDMLHEPLFVPRTIPIARLFRIFKQSKTHMSLVVSEYGKVVGLITMEDLLEELFGEIHDEREQQKSSVSRSLRLVTGGGDFPRVEDSAPVRTAPTGTDDHGDVQ